LVISLDQIVKVFDALHSSIFPAPEKITHLIEQLEEYWIFCGEDYYCAFSTIDFNPLNY